MKIKNFAALLCMLFMAQLSFGQITLKHSYKSYISPVYEHYGDHLAQKYLSYDKDASTIIISNIDHSVYKTIKPNLSVGESLSNVYSLYTNVINADPLIELYYSVNNDIYIINEDGELIKKIENAFTLEVLPTKDGFIIHTYYSVGSGSDIYSLPTSLSNITSLKSQNEGHPYPNPAKQTITIPYQLSGQWGIISIYNASGQFVEQKSVDKNFNSLLLDISGYAKGMYYYKVDKQKGEFMVN